jgi:hypothetical protein
VQQYVTDTRRIRPRAVEAGAEISRGNHISIIGLANKKAFDEHGFTHASVPPAVDPCSELRRAPSQKIE